MSRKHSTDPSAPADIIAELHVYEDKYGRRRFRDYMSWPHGHTCEWRYLGRYDGTIVKSAFPDETEARHE